MGGRGGSDSGGGSKVGGARAGGAKSAGQLQKEIAETQKALNEALKGTGKKASKQDSIDLLGALGLAGSMFGGGSFRTKLYRAARFIGDAQSVQKGTVAKRLGRKFSGRVSGRFMRKFFR